MTLGERIKKLRNELDLTQQEFAAKIGSVQNTITGYETGRRAPSNQVISLICHEFNVDETWLRTGEGEMFLETPDTATGRLAKELGLDEFMQSVVSEYLKLSEEQRKVVRNFVYKIAEQPIKDVDVPAPAPPPQDPEPTPNIAEELAKLKSQNEEIMRQNRMLVKKVAAMEEEDAAWEAAQRAFRSPSR